MITRILLLLGLLLSLSATVSAASVRIGVAEFKVTGAAGKDELKGALQSMLASRLEGDKIQVVGVNDSPDMTVVGTYIVFGKVFSLDGQLVASSGKVVGRAFEQGEGADDVIPAVGRLAQKLGTEIGKIPSGELTGFQGTRSTPATSNQVAATVPLPSADIVRKPPPVVAKPEGDLIRPERVASNTERGILGQRLDGAMIAMVPVKRLDKGGRELVVALETELRLYRHEQEFTLVNTEKGFGGNEKIVALDIADLDADGVQEIYVTAFNGVELASRVYLLEGGRFVKMASNLPYFFRGIALKGEVYRIYAQEMGIDEDFYGDLREVVKNGASIQLGNSLKLPPKGNIYNMNVLPDKNGSALYVVLSADGYLTVYNDGGEELWRSSDKFGGSEMYFTRDDMQNIRVTGSQYRKRFIEQRLTVTRSGTVIVPKHEGSFVIGNSRSFSKSSVYSFAWSGAGLDELWHTKVDQNYLADYFYDGERKELLLLEVVKKAGITEKGASALVVRQVE
jgi:hypothetical protein